MSDVERFSSMRPGDLLNELEDRAAEMRAAKAEHDGSPESRERLQAAKVAYDQLRSWQRQADIAAGRRAGPGVATPDTVATAAAPKEV